MPAKRKPAAPPPGDTPPPPGELEVTWEDYTEGLGRLPRVGYLPGRYVPRAGEWVNIPGRPTRTVLQVVTSYDVEPGRVVTKVRVLVARADEENRFGPAE